jgi:hypothetical protein
MKIVFLAISAVLFCAAGGSAQDSHSFRAGINGGATIFPFAAIGGLELDHRVTTCLRTGVRVSFIAMVGPCADVDEDLCIGEGRIYSGFISFLTESLRRPIEPYIELGLGAYHYGAEIKTGRLAAYGEAGAGLEVWRFRIGLRYGRVFDGEVEDLVHSKIVYFTPILGVNVPF